MINLRILKKIISWILIFTMMAFSCQALSEGLAQRITLDKKLAKLHDFSFSYKINDYGNVFIVAEFPDSTGKNYVSSSSIVTITLASGNSVSFYDYVGRGEKSHKTEVIFENEKDFIDASISVIYRCRTEEGMICQARHYTIESIRQWQAN